MPVEIKPVEKKCLTKADIVETVFSELSVDKTEAIEIVETLIETMKEGLIADKKLMLSGFGIFEVKHKKSRQGRNPQTGNKIMLEERNVVRFRPSPLLVEKINANIEKEQPTS